MKSIIHLLTVLFCCFGLASVAIAQTELRVATADIGHLYENYHAAIDAQAKFAGTVEEAQSEGEAMMAEGNAMVEEYRQLVEEAENPALSDEAREAAQQEADALLQQIREKEQNVREFQANTQQMLERRQRNYRELLMDEIREVVQAVAREQGATLVLDTSSRSSAGLPTVIFADPAFDITEAALAELNREQN